MLKIILREVITQNFNHFGQTMAQLNFPSQGGETHKARKALPISSSF